MNPPGAAPSAPWQLAASGVGKIYPGGVQALVDIEFLVASGETVALIGESGSGKTSLLRLFNRTLEPSVGEVRVRGQDVAVLDPIALRRSIGYVPQDGGLMPHWTVGRNVELVPRLLVWPRTRRRDRAREMLDLVGLEPDSVIDRYPAQLSGGQRQRVSIARALAADPEILLLDEPFGALDAITRHELQDEFLTIEERLDKTMLFVTHDIDEAIRLADRVGVMQSGRLLQLDEPELLLARPAHPYVTRLLEHRPSHE